MSYSAEKPSNKQKNIKDFYKYCFRVGIAVAASVAILIILPFVNNTSGDIPQRSAILSEQTVVTKDEAINSPDTYETLTKFKTKITSKLFKN